MIIPRQLHLIIMSSVNENMAWERMKKAVRKHESYGLNSLVVQFLSYIVVI